MEDKKDCAGGCDSGMSKCCGSMGRRMCCGWGGMHRYSLLRVILLLVITWLVFSAGVKVGEWKAGFYGFYGMGDGYWGSRSMMNGFPYGGFYGPGMMQGWNSKQSTTTAR